MKGRILIRDIDKLRDIANPMGLEVIQSQEFYQIYKSGTLEKLGYIDSNVDWSKAPKLIKEMFRTYNERIIKLAVQKKGYKVKSVKQLDDKMIIRISE